MARVRMRVRTMMLTVMALSVILATAGRWIALGGPVGFSCGWCQTSLGGRTIRASSYHLLTNVSLMADKDSVVLDVDDKNVVVRGSEVTVNGTTRCLIPSGCKELEFMASGGVLRVLVDGKTLQEIRR
jgi:hypothetical protein